MSRPLRIIDTGEMPARWNVAVTAVLTEMHRMGRSPDTLRFHRYPASVLIGRHQVLGQEVHVSECKADGIEIARRVTGGGAVYMAPGALAWDLVTAGKTVGTQLHHATATIGEAVAAALARVGLPARYRSENEVEIAGRKVCGMSGYFDGGTLVYQGTILVDTSLAEMARYLKLPPKPAQSSRRDLAERLITVAEFLGRTPDLRDIEGALALGISHSLGRLGEPDRLTAEELSLAEDWHRTEFGLESFVSGVEPKVADMTMIGNGEREPRCVPLQRAQSP